MKIRKLDPKRDVTIIIWNYDCSNKLIIDNYVNMPRKGETIKCHTLNTDGVQYQFVVTDVVHNFDANEIKIYTKIKEDNYE